MENIKYNYEYTNHVSIYKGTYWGGFKTNKPEPLIVDNRNKFVVNFDIIKNIGSSKKGVPIYVRNHYYGNGGRIGDHNEVYLTKNKEYIIISSPYGTEDSNSHIELKKRGFLNLGYNLYSEWAKTYYKIVPMKTRSKVP